MYYIKPFLYDIINVFVRFSKCYFTNCIGYDTNCIGAVTKSNQMGTNKPFAFKDSNQYFEISSSDEKR